MMVRSKGPLLIIENNPMDIDLTVRAFEEHKIDNEIIVCRDGDEAIEYIDEHENGAKDKLPALVLLDLRLSRVDGLEVIRYARNKPVWNKIPFVVLTTSREDRDVDRAYEFGANSFVVKPVDFDEFNQLVKLFIDYWLVTNEPSSDKGMRK